MAGTAHVQVFRGPGRAPRMLSGGEHAGGPPYMWFVLEIRKGGGGQAWRLLENPRELSSNPT